MHDIVNCRTSVSGEGQSFYENVAREREQDVRSYATPPSYYLTIL